MGKSSVKGKLKVQELRSANPIGPVSSRKVPPTDESVITSDDGFPFFHQPQLTVTVEFIIPQHVNQGSLDEWLTSLEQDIPSPAWHRSANLSDETDHVKYWITTCLKLSQSILLALRIPVFDTFTVLRCNTNPSKERTWRATIRLPCPDRSFYSIIIETINRSLGLAVWATKNAYSPATKQRFFEKIQNEILSPYGGNVSFGKSTLEILRVAYAKNIPILSLGRGVYQLGWGIKAEIIDRSSTTGDSALAPRMTSNKSASTKVLGMAGLPGPINRTVRDIETALKSARELGWPVVIKPVDGERGEGVSVNVEEALLYMAFEKARDHSPSQTVLVEKQVEGVCYRLFIAGGDLLYAVKRLPIGVYGDGERSIIELVNEACEKEQSRPPWKRSRIKAIDSPAQRVLRSMNFTELSIAENGQFVPLRPIETTASGGVDVDVTIEVHPENIRAAIYAAQITGLDVAGVDLITTDISRPWHETGAVINEVNYAPLLGGGEISRRYVSDYVERLVRGDGRIPAEVFVGGEVAFAAAEKRGAELAKRLPGLVITSATHTQSVDGQEIPISLSGLRRRAQALIMRRNVDALILVVQDDEVLNQGPALDAFDQIIHIDNALRSYTTPEHIISSEQVNAVVTVLQNRERKGKK